MLRGRSVPRCWREYVDRVFMRRNSASLHPKQVLSRRQWHLTSPQNLSYGNSVFRHRVLPREDRWMEDQVCKVNSHLFYPQFWWFILNDVENWLWLAGDSPKCLKILSAGWETTWASLPKSIPLSWSIKSSEDGSEWSCGKARQAKGKRQGWPQKFRVEHVSSSTVVDLPKADRWDTPQGQQGGGC